MPLIYPTVNFSAVNWSKIRALALDRNGVEVKVYFYYRTNSLSLAQGSKFQMKCGNMEMSGRKIIRRTSHLSQLLSRTLDSSRLQKQLKVQVPGRIRHSGVGCKM